MRLAEYTDSIALPAAVEFWPMSTELSMRGDVLDPSIAHLAHLGVIDDCTVNSNNEEGWWNPYPPAEVDDARKRFQEGLRPAMELARERSYEPGGYGEIQIFTIVTTRSVRLSEWGKGFADACDARAVWRELR